MTIGRIRRIKQGGARVTLPTNFAPFTTMSLAEGLVYKELETRGVPFTYRWFDGDAPNTKELLKGWAPEFTLKEYKRVITVIGGFYGTLPDVLNQTALGQVALEMDGWKLVILYESDIKTIGATAALDKAWPELARPQFLGEARLGPYGMPDLMSRLREARKNSINFNPHIAEQKVRSSGRHSRNRRRTYQFGSDRQRRFKRPDS